MTRHYALKETGKSMIVEWAKLGSGEEGAPFDLSSYDASTIQATGAFGAGKAVIEGSLDGESYDALSDAHGLRLEVASAGISVFHGEVSWIRPRILGGDPETGISIKLMVRRRD